MISEILYLNTCTDLHMLHCLCLLCHNIPTPPIEYADNNILKNCCFFQHWIHSLTYILHMNLKLVYVCGHASTIYIHYPIKHHLRLVSQSGINTFGPIWSKVWVQAEANVYQFLQEVISTLEKDETKRHKKHKNTKKCTVDGSTVLLQTSDWCHKLIWKFRIKVFSNRCYSWKCFSNSRSSLPAIRKNA